MYNEKEVCPSWTPTKVRLKMEKANKKNFNLDDYRFGGDEKAIDSNPQLRDYLRVLYDQIKYENKMVGDFSVYGTYKIKPEMQDFLIKEIKFFQERKGDVVYVTRVLEDVILNFRITFNIVGSAQQAFLDIVEREVRFDEDNIMHTTRLDEIVKVGHPDFVNYVYKEWNVWLSLEDLAFEDNPLIRNLLDRIALFGALCPMLGMSSMAYVKSMLTILPKCGPTGLLIATQFNQKMNAMSLLQPDFAKDGMGMKRLLDGLMRKHNFFPVLAGVKEALPAIKDFVQPIKSIDMSSIKIPPKNKKMDGATLGKGKDL